MRKGFLANYMIHLGTFGIVKMNMIHGVQQMAYRETVRDGLPCQTILNGGISKYRR